MALTDPLGDMLTRIRNGQQAKKDSVLSPASKLRANVLEVVSDLLVGAHRQGAFWSLDGQRAVLDLRGDAARDRHRPFADAAHQNTSASTSPPTF